MIYKERKIILPVIVGILIFSINFPINSFATTFINDLGTLDRGSVSTPSAINESGQVIGNSLTSSGEQHAFVWDSVNGMQDLGTLGGTFSIPRAINEAGQVIGFSQTSFGVEQHAFVWDSVNGMRDVGTLRGTFSSAIAINESGQVIGNSLTSFGEQHAFLKD